MEAGWRRLGGLGLTKRGHIGRLAEGVRGLVGWGLAEVGLLGWGYRICVATRTHAGHRDPLDKKCGLVAKG